MSIIWSSDWLRRRCNAAFNRPRVRYEQTGSLRRRFHAGNDSVVYGIETVGHQRWSSVWFTPSFPQYKQNVSGSGRDLGQAYVNFTRNSMDQIRSKVNDELWILNLFDVRQRLLSPSSIRIEWWLSCIIWQYLHFLRNIQLIYTPVDYIKFAANFKNHISPLKVLCIYHSMVVEKATTFS